MNFSKYVDKVFYINLDHRDDRREEIEDELKTMDIQYERVPGIKTSPGIVGCGYSHLKVLKMARERGYRNILIFEDDFQFLVSKELLYETMDKIFTEVPSYDVIMLAYNTIKKEVYTKNLDKIIESQSASAYIVHSKFYDKLINLYDDAIPTLEANPHLHWLYANDQIWKRLQPSSEWYSTCIRIGKQRPSMGETGYEPKFCDYGS